MRAEVNETVKERSKLTKEEWREYTKTVWQIANTSDPLHPAVFPIEIPRRLVKMFSFVGELVLDPFAGVGTTAKAAIEVERMAVCVEQNPLFAARIATDPVLADAQDQLQLVTGDSRNLAFLDDNTVDLVVTSPPYWNKADYGPNESNLGNIPSYSEFFSKIRPVFVECFRALRPGRKLCLVTANVNQHTDHGLLTYPLASDFTIMLRELGFLLISEIIWNKDGTGGRWGSANNQRPIFGSYPYPPNFLFKNVHEYIIVVAKPPTTVTRGPKVINYRESMGDMLPALPVDLKQKSRRSPRT